METGDTEGGSERRLRQEAQVIVHRSDEPPAGHPAALTLGVWSAGAQPAVRHQRIQKLRRRGRTARTRTPDCLRHVFTCKGKDQIGLLLKKGLTCIVLHHVKASVH